MVREKFTVKTSLRKCVSILNIAANGIQLKKLHISNSMVPKNHKASPQMVFNHKNYMFMSQRSRRNRNLKLY